MALGLYTGREEPRGLEDILQISSVYIQTSKILPRQTQISRNTLWMAKLKDLRRILLSLIGLSAPPALRLLLLCQSSCHIITGPPEQGTERWAVSTGKYVGRVVNLQAPAFHLWMQEAMAEVSPCPRKDLKN